MNTNVKIGELPHWPDEPCDLSHEFAGDLSPTDRADMENFRRAIIEMLLKYGFADARVLLQRKHQEPIGQNDAFYCIYDCLIASTGRRVWLETGWGDTPFRAMFRTQGKLEGKYDLSLPQTFDIVRLRDMTWPETETPTR